MMLPAFLLPPLYLGDFRTGTAWFCAPLPRTRSPVGVAAAARLRDFSAMVGLHLRCTTTSAPHRSIRRTATVPLRYRMFATATRYCTCLLLRLSCWIGCTTGWNVRAPVLAPVHLASPFTPPLLPDYRRFRILSAHPTTPACSCCSRFACRLPHRMPARYNAPASFSPPVGIRLYLSYAGDFLRVAAHTVTFRLVCDASAYLPPTRLLLTSPFCACYTHTLVSAALVVCLLPPCCRHLCLLFSYALFALPFWIAISTRVLRVATCLRLTALLPATPYLFHAAPPSGYHCRAPTTFLSATGLYPPAFSYAFPAPSPAYLPATAAPAPFASHALYIYACTCNDVTRAATFHTTAWVLHTPAHSFAVLPRRCRAAFSACCHRASVAATAPEHAGGHNSFFAAPRTRIFCRSAVAAFSFTRNATMDHALVLHAFVLPYSARGLRVQHRSRAFRVSYIFISARCTAFAPPLPPKATPPPPPPAPPHTLLTPRYPRPHTPPPPPTTATLPPHPHPLP